ncbi:MAG TPA: sigma-70 family RNA polymerase sigma factor [Candidatus Hydrogenedentes bacterium]|nr:sigma-70 family RNA polymerase sigma factor [Candidatus Hydrogenedentota bacterium]HQH66767.1 sigma-70 family RNA polymerase sigma factor [Candidatus Hydrogenedentota bacterium]
MNETHEQPTDEALAERARDGDTRAFEMLVKRYQQPLFNYIRRMIGNASDAEDLFQDTFMKVYSHLERFRPEGSFRGWLYRIATNTCRDALRRRKLRRAFSLDTGLGPGDAPSGERYASGAPNPAEKAAEAELAGRLAAAVQSLSIKHRSVFLMARYEGMSYEEISQSLGIPVGTVKSRMNTAVNALMDALEEPS